MYQLTVVIIVSENVIGTKENLLNCLGKNLLFGLTEREKFFIDKASAIYFTADGIVKTSIYSVVCSVFLLSHL